MDNDWCIGGIIFAFCLLLLACTRPRTNEPEDAARFMGFMAQCEGDQKDAARYRWLRATTNYVTSKGQRIELTVPEELDAAIDSCIADDGVKTGDGGQPK